MQHLFAIKILSVTVRCRGTTGLFINPQCRYTVNSQPVSRCALCHSMSMMYWVQ